MSSPITTNDSARSSHRLPPRPRGLGFVLSLLVIAIYCGFILLVAYDKPLLSKTIVPGLSWGILLGALVIIAAWTLTLIYVAVSNKQAAER